MKRREPAAVAELERDWGIPAIVPSAPKVLSLDEILALDVKPARMLVDHLIPVPGASLLVGAAKAGKTLVAMQAAIAVASGRAHLFGEFQILDPGPVLVIERDDPAGGASIKTILEKSPAPVDGIPFHLVTNLPFDFGPEFVDWLRSQIRAIGAKLVVVDSYTAMRGSRAKGIDIVKAEQAELGALDALAKEMGCAIVIIHHSSKGSAGLDWSEKAAGTFAMSAATEAQIFISRFSEMDISAPERLVRVRGRHSEDLEMVLRFRPETLSFDHVLSGGAASLYPELMQIKAEFGTRSFSPKDLAHTTGQSKATVHRHIDRLYRASALSKRGFGEYMVNA